MKPNVGDSAFESEILRRAVRLGVPVLVAVALALRLSYYLLEPSLSTDEASLALNLMHHSYAGLFGRLDFNQAAPPGFLLVQKLAIDALGPSPYALRLLPFVAGAAACFLIYAVAVRIAGRRAAIIALALFAVSEPLVSYASTNKQYSVDVAVALALYAVFLSIRSRVGLRDAVLFGLVGGVAVTFSHPAAFVLAAIWLVLAVENVRGRRWPQVTRLAGVGAVWLGCLTAAYLLTRASIEQIQRSVAGPSSISVTAAGRTVGGAFRYLLGIPGFAPEVRLVLTCIGVVLALLGLRELFRTSSGPTAALVAPAILAVGAVWLGLYPSFPRTFLFLEPALIVLMASGAQFLLSRRGQQIVRAGGGLALATIFGAAAFQTLHHFRPSVVKEPSRALSYLVEHAQTSDSLYVSRPAQFDYRYYLECGCFSNPGAVAKAKNLWPLRPTAGYGQFDAALHSAPPSFVAGSPTSSERDFETDFAPLLGRGRVWVLVINPQPDPMGIRILTNVLRKHGRLFDEFPEGSLDATAVLFLYRSRARR
jgi:4-amino-4-deoxy-L-arabinose transferase-like glycosyltransferase